VHGQGDPMGHDPERVTFDENSQHHFVPTLGVGPQIQTFGA